MTIKSRLVFTEAGILLILSSLMNVFHMNTGRTAAHRQNQGIVLYIPGHKHYNRLKKAYIFILTIMSLFAGPVLTASASIRYNNIRFRQFSVSDGLPHNQINTISQDRDGFIWIGTANGLCRFDGYSFQKIDSGTDTIPISNAFIQNIYNDHSHNRLWIHTDRWFCCYDLDTEQFRRMKVNGSDRQSVSFLETSSGELLITTYGGVFRFNEETGEFENIIPIPKKRIGRILEDSSGTLWIKVDSGLKRYDRKNGRFIPYHIMLDDFKGAINQITMTYDDRIVFTDNRDFYVYDIHNDRLSMLPKNTDTEGYRCVETDSEGNIWIGTEFGIFIYDAYDRLIAHFEQTPDDLSGLNDSPVYCIFKDGRDNMWIGTYFGGINYFIHGTDQIRTYPFGNSSNHLSGKAVRQIINDGKGGLLIATEDGGLNHIDSAGKITRSDVIHRKLGLKNVKNVHSVYFCQNGDLLVGLYTKNFIRYSPATGHVTDYARFAGRNLSAFCMEETPGGIYYAGPEGLFFVPVEGSPKVQRISNTRTYCMLKQNDSIIWVGSRHNGIYELNTVRNTLRHIDRFPGMRPWVSYLYKDSRERTWISTDNGLFVTDPQGRKLVMSFTKEELMANSVKGVVEDDFGYIWAGTDNGLCRISPEDSVVLKITDEDGLPIKQFNFSSACKKPDGELYFGTINGMISFYPDQIEVPDQDFKIRITNIYYDDSKSRPGKDRSGDSQRLTLSHAQARSVRIEYSGLNFRYMDKTLYTMKMEGLDKRWQTVGDQHQVRFSNLPTGKYVLKIKASYDGHTWDEEGQLSLPVHVRAPWWASVPAFVLYSIIIVLGIAFIIRFTRTRMMLGMQLKAEQEKRLNIEKMNKQKLDFFAYVSHDLKTPLTLILSPLQRLISKKQITNEDKKMLEVVYTNASRMNYLIDELLTFSKIEMNQLDILVRKGNIMAFLQSISNLFKFTAEDSDIEFVVDLEKTEQEVWFSPSKLSRIMYNLLSNAFKYSSAGDYVRLEARLLEEGSSTIARISVKDSGRGIPADMVSKIFDNYFQVKPSDSRKGFGLGLSLTRSLVRMHKGDIKVISEEGKGSEFIVTLNVSENAYTPQQRSLEAISADDITKYQQRIKDTLEMIPDNRSDEERNVSGRESILIVEDNREMNSYIAGIFRENYDIVQAYNGKEAYCIIENKLLPDIIISDVMMPEMDGIELLGKVKGDVSTSHIPVILLTAKTDDSAQTQGYMAGADAYIAKPFNSRNLELLVQNIQKNRKRNIERFKQAEDLNVTKLVNNPRDERFMKELMELTVANLGNEDFSVNDITSALRISRSRLHIKVKSLTGLPITQFIKSIRLRESKKLLLEGLNVAETSYAVGFSDPNYFTKSFRTEFGMTPTEFVKSRRPQNHQICYTENGPSPQP